MNRRCMQSKALSGYVVSLMVIGGFLGGRIGMAQNPVETGVEKPFVSWQSPAKLHGLVGSDKGDLRIGTEGIEFQAVNHSTQKWAYEDIQTFRISAHRLILATYQNRKLHLPGIARYKFDLEGVFPSAIAAELSKEVQRPSQNAVPDMATQDIGCTVIPAHHHMLTSGTNGVLRICDEGIDYVTNTAEDSRSWRWADLQTLSDLDPYHLMVFGYRDTYNFDLKEALSRSLFYRSVNAIDAYDSESGMTPKLQFPDVSGKHRHGVGDE